jgi:putative transposase
MGVSEPTVYCWKKQFVGMGVPEIRRLIPILIDQNP